MSTRFYPRYVKGNPQLRIFLPDWKLTMIKPKDPVPDNVVVFKTDIKMTDWDIKNYLEKIYKIEVASINSRVMPGHLRRSSMGLTKFNDYRLANVSLPVGQTFKWPNLFPEEKQKDELDDYKKTVEQLSKNRKLDPNASGIPSWFN